MQAGSPYRRTLLVRKCSQTVTFLLLLIVFSSCFSAKHAKLPAVVTTFALQQHTFFTTVGWFHINKCFVLISEITGTYTHTCMHIDKREREEENNTTASMIYTNIQTKQTHNFKHRHQCPSMVRQESTPRRSARSLVTLVATMASSWRCWCEWRERLSWWGAKKVERQPRRASRALILRHDDRRASRRRREQSWRDFRERRGEWQRTKLVSRMNTGSGDQPRW